MIATQRLRSARLAQQDLSVRGAAPLDFPTSQLQDVLILDQNAVIPPTPLFAAISSDLFEVSIYVVCTVAGAGILDVILNWGDGYAIHNEPAVAGVNLNVIGNFLSMERVIRVLEDTLVTYEVAIAGLGGGAEYSLFIKADKL